jgi:hypothetical protein
MKESVEETATRYVVQDLFGVDTGFRSITFPKRYKLDMTFESFEKSIELFDSNPEDIVKKVNECIQKVFPGYKLCSITHDEV